MYMTHDEVKWINNKNQKIYTVTGKCTNATNKDDGKVMIKYFNDKGEEFVREADEFREKFTLLDTKYDGII